MKKQLSSLTVICVLWQDEWEGQWYRPYTPDWVSRLKDMVTKNLSYDFEFICLSNVDPLQFRDDIKVYPFERKAKAWWNKIEVFRENLTRNERILYIDIDSIIVNGLDDVVDFSSDFALFDVWDFSTMPNTKQAIKRAKKKKGCLLNPVYSSCMMVMDRHARPQVYYECNQNIMDKYCGDQDWISVCLGNDESMFPKGWGRKINRSDRGENPKFDEDLKIIACHPVKNHLLEGLGYDYLNDIWDSNV